MSEIDQKHSDIDFNHVMLLLSVIDKAVNVAPSMQAILGAAQHELKLIHDQALEEQKERAEARRAEEASRVEPRETNLQSAEEVDEDEDAEVIAGSAPIARRV